MTRLTPGRALKDLKHQLAVKQGAARDVIMGLEGKPFQWGSTEYRSKGAVMVNSFGLTLLTKNQIKKRGYALRKRVSPVGCAYFEAPIKKYADLYILECQCDQVKFDPIRRPPTKEERIAEIRQKIDNLFSYIAQIEGEGGKPTICPSCSSTEIYWNAGDWSPVTKFQEQRTVNWECEDCGCHWHNGEVRDVEIKK